MALSERDRRAVVLGGIVLGVIAVYFLAIEPLAKAYGGLVGEHRRLAARVARTIHDNRKAEYYSGRLAEYEQTVGELLTEKPYDEQITAVGEQFIATAQSSGVTLQGFTPTAATLWAEDPALALASFHIDADVRWPRVKQAATSWENVFKFIAGLHRIPGVLSVERLDLSSPANAGGPGGPGGPGKGGIITVRMTVSVLVQARTESDELWAQ